jgi:signal transduction histidine kinase
MTTRLSTASDPIEPAAAGALVEALPEGVGILDAIDLTVRYANPALSRLLGRTSDELIGRPLCDFIDPEDVARTLELTRVQGRIEILLRVPGGTLAPVALSATRTESDRGPVLAVSAFDLSAQFELMRRERDQLERIGRRKDEFIAMLGHELRNPLAPLRHAAEVFGDAARGVPGPTVEELTALVHRQVDHMARLIADLLEIGRSTTGRLPVHPQRMRVSEILVPSIESTAALLQRRHHTLVRDVAEADELELDADPVRLTQLVTNLLDNAAKYTAEGGRIELSCREHDRWLTINVRDEGVGIAAEELEPIFEPFYQAGASLDRSSGGLGVGLALARAIAELHGGTLQARSEGPGRGSTFEVRLPGVRRIVSERRVDVASSAPRRGRPLDVLVIDDNEDAARMLALLLERRGCRVDLGFRGAEGIARVAAQRYDLAFVDIGLPDIDGYVFAERIANEAHCPTHLIALTGYGQPEDRARALAAGFHEHVVKPLSPKRLDEIVAIAGAAERR